MKYNKWIHSRKWYVLYWLVALVSFIVYHDRKDFTGVATIALGVIAAVIGANAYEKNGVDKKN
jgi:hypothetical protein